MAFSFTGATLPAGEGTLVSLSFEEISGGGVISASDVVVTVGDFHEATTYGPESATVGACADNDGDTDCDVVDSDDDNDGVDDDNDSAPFDNFVCSDTDGDTCEDCSSGSYDVAADGWDYDTDGACDAGDSDDDNDGAADDVDSDDNDPSVCNDDDGDTCDECSSGTYNSASDGFDYDTDGLCDDGDTDDDNDGALDDVDS